MKKTVQVDIAIIGGGIAGLWLLNRVRAQGYSVILLESNSLGAGQTGKSQGIIHGGVKFALQGVMTQAAQAIAEMPAIWKQCLAGTGEIDLTDARVLSPCQHLWSQNTITGKIGGFLASMAMNSHVATLKKDQYPALFKHADFHGQVYQLNEIVLDVNSVMRKLVKPHQDVIFKTTSLKQEHLHFDDAGRLTEIDINAEPLEPIAIKAEKYIFTAGAGNEILLQAIKDKKEMAMQRRPLHMVMMKSRALPPLYAHCLGVSTMPRITITTHYAKDGEPVWYMGGQLAEEGVKRDHAAQVSATKKELKEMFPWIDTADAQFASFFIDRAEGLQADGSRPDSCVVKENQNVLVAWPTKLALAPRLADEVMKYIKNMPKNIGDTRALRAWPIPALAKPIWDELLC